MLLQKFVCFLYNMFEDNRAYVTVDKASNKLERLVRFAGTQWIQIAQGRTVWRALEAISNIEYLSADIMMENIHNSVTNICDHHIYRLLVADEK